MSTMNISLPAEQVTFVDNLINKFNYANRSEFFRSILRAIQNKPEIVEQASVFPLQSPSTRSIKKIMADFRKTGKYNDAFLKDLEEGLKDSDYFKP